MGCDVSAVAASDVRAWVATWIEAVAGGYAFRESPRILGVDAEAASVAHQSFSVLMNGETDLGQMRQRAGSTTRVSQSVTVRLAWRVRPGADQLTDYDAALDAAEAVTRLMLLRPRTGLAAFHVKYEGISGRSLVDGGKFVLTDVNFMIDHHLSLAAVA
jgi:hypothetical protein